MGSDRKRLGRRPGAGSSRGAVLEAARREFARVGYDRATVRSVASAAEVDPAVIYHFFGSKAGLLEAALEFPVPADVVAEFLEGGAPTGEQLITFVLSLWEDPEVAERLTAMLRVAATHPDGSAAVTTLIERVLIGPLTEAIGEPDARLRAGLVASQIAGLALVRLVVPIEPMANSSIAELAGPIGETLDRYLGPGTSQQESEELPGGAEGRG